MSTIRKTQICVCISIYGILISRLDGLDDARLTVSAFAGRPARSPPQAVLLLVVPQPFQLYKQASSTQKRETRQRCSIPALLDPAQDNKEKERETGRNGAHTRYIKLGIGHRRGPSGRGGMSRSNGEESKPEITIEFLFLLRSLLEA